MRSAPARPGPGLLLILALAGCGPSPRADQAGTGFLTGAEDGPIFYRVLGGGSDTIVVVHGGPGAGIASIRPAIEPLADEFTLILYDQRGGGRSVLPEDTTLLAAPYHVADLEAVRRYFQLRRMKIVAHSFGAVVVARYAQAHPDRIERLVLHGATGPSRDAAAAAARAVPAPPRDTALARRARQSLSALLRGEAKNPIEACREYEAAATRLAELDGESSAWRGTSCDAPAEAVRYYFRHTAQFAPRTFGRWDFRDGLRDVEAPVLVVSGTRDSASAAMQRQWAEAYPAGRLLELPGAGKGPLMERSDTVLPAIAEFLHGG